MMQWSAFSADMLLEDILRQVLPDPLLQHPYSLSTTRPIT